MRIIHIFIAIIIAPLAIAHDLSIQTNLQDQLYTSTAYENPFKVSNINYSLGHAYNVTVNYELWNNESIILNSSFILDDINRFKTAGTGQLIFIEPGIYILKGSIIAASVNDPNPEN